MALFLAVVAVVVTCGVLATRAAAPLDRRSTWTLRAVAFAAGWMGLTLLPTLTGLASPDHPLPGVPMVMGLVLTGAVALAASPLGGRIAAAVPLAALVAFQGFRLPLEVVLHLWGDAGVAPTQLTWSGSNLDVVTGVVSLALAPFVPRWPRLAWVAQAVGVVLLANVLRIVVGSLPTPWQVWPDPLMLPFRVPHVWIASVCVAGALAAHGITLRKLLTPR